MVECAAVMTEPDPMFPSVYAALYYAFGYTASVPASAMGKAMREAMRTPRPHRDYTSPAGLDGCAQAGMMQAQLDRAPLSEDQRALLLLRYGREDSAGRVDAIGRLAHRGELATWRDPMQRRRIVGRVLWPEQRTDGKIGSSHDRLILELVPTEKLVDLIRNPWGFTGTLVKFKLQVGLTDDELLAIARKSMADSHADFIVANCLE